jgi:hypothetical protein
MDFRMIEPWKHPRSQVLWFRKRVPEKFVALLGRREIKFSLGTKDMGEVRLHSIEENLELERTWRDYAEGRPRGHDLDYRQVVALVEEFSTETIEKNQSNPGKVDAWEASMQRDRKLRKLPHFPLTRPQHHRMLFGAQVEGFLALTLTSNSFDIFLREFLEAKAHAEGVLARNARADFSPDCNAERFPEWTPVSDEQQLPKLSEEFVADRQVSRGTRKKYKGILDDALVARIGPLHRACHAGQRHRDRRPRLWRGGGLGRVCRNPQACAVRGRSCRHGRPSKKKDSGPIVIMKSAGRVIASGGLPPGRRFNFMQMEFPGQIAERFMEAWSWLEPLA